MDRGRPRATGEAGARPHAPNRGGRGGRDRGQSLVEFALILPFLLLLTLVGLDFGRVYLGWINLQNMARIAANFAANHPEAWSGASNSAELITQYQNQITADASATNCQLTPTTPPNPTFTDENGDGVATRLGDHARVSLTCHFTILTPVISSIVGGTVAVSASAVFPVKSGLAGQTIAETTCLKPSAAINANPPNGTAPLTVDFTDASGGGAANTWVWNFGDGTGSLIQDPGNHVYNPSVMPETYDVTLTVGNVCGETSATTSVTVTSATATPNLCTVPNFVQNVVRWNDAPAIWSAAGFTTTIINGPGHPQGNYKITYQSLTAETSVQCNASIVVNG